MLPRLVRTRRHLPTLLATLVALLIPSLGSAQQGITTGAVTGQVTDAEGSPLANVAVRVRHVERGIERQTLTGEEGRFTIGLLQPGNYTVRAEMPPLRPVEVGPVRVTAGERTPVDLTLLPIEAEEIRVTVGGREYTDIDVSQGGVIQLIDQEQVAELPTAGRDFTDFIALDGLITPSGAPTVRRESGTGGQFSFLGARTSTSNITVDGVSANNQFFGENRGSSRVPFTFSLESVEEFQIITNGFDVEFGRFAGGQLNAITKSGTNEHSAEAWFFSREEALTFENFDGTEPADFTVYQFGGRLSGPIIEDKLHYFVSGDLQQRDQPAFALEPARSGIAQSTVNEIASIMTDVYGFDQETVDRAFGKVDQTDDQYNIFGRLDWSVNDNHRVSVRTNFSTFDNENDEISTGGRESTLGGATFETENISLVAELNSQLASNVFNTLRFQWADEDRPRSPNTGLPEIEIGEVPTVTGREATIDIGGTEAGISFRNNLEERQFQVVNNLNFQLGDHTLKLGTDNIFSKVNNEFWLFGNGLFEFPSIEDFRNQQADFFLRAVPDLDAPFAPVTSFDQRAWSVYIQDEWQATDRLRLTAGVRWDYQEFRDPPVALDDPDFQDDLVDQFGVDPTRVPDDKDNIGPRLSFTYDVTGDERNVLRGGAGLFYDDIPIVTHGNTTLNNPDPLLFNICIAAAAPDVSNLAQMAENPELIPNTCDPDFVNRETGFDIGFDPFGIGIIGSPDVNVWDPDTENPRTVRANLGYERRIGDRWKAGFQTIFSQTWDLFRGRQLTQADLAGQRFTDGNPRQPFFTQGDGRPVWVEPGDWDPEDTSEDDVSQAEDLRFLLQQTDGADARAYSFKTSLQGAPTDNFRVGANWTVNVSKDNSSVECCTAFALTTEVPTAGNLNFLGDPGDEAAGAWGPSKNEQRHVIVTNFIWRAPLGFQISGIYRAQTGLPFTPVVLGDLNGDGIASNDRPFLPDPATAAPDDPLDLDGLQFASMDDLDAYRELLDSNSCLREAVGTIINRNTCRDPWWHSVDLKIKKRFQAPRGNQFELIADLFNVLDAFGFGAGEFVFKRNVLFNVPEADDGNLNDENEVIVEVEDFGEEVPAGFDPFQFQAQLGVRWMI